MSLSKLHCQYHGASVVVVVVVDVVVGSVVVGEGSFSSPGTAIRNNVIFY